MNFKTSIFLLLIAFSLSVNSQLFAQNYINVSQVSVRQNINVSNYGLYSVANSVDAFRNAWQDEKKRDREIEKAQSQLAIVKNLFSEKTTLPEIIVDGWHNVKVSDNFNYCSDAKALVENNAIKTIVMDNYAELPLTFDTISHLKNAQSTINLKLPNGNSDTAVVYFLYDLDSPTTTTKPLAAGYVTFWSALGNAKTIEILINEQKQGNLGYDIESADCFSQGAFTLKLKPGTYDFRAEANGSKSWSGTILIKEGECFTYELNKKNKE
ncbi:MAG: hypothetical protein R2797_04680 [Gelidibacter sp.]